MIGYHDGAICLYIRPPGPSTRAQCVPVQVEQRILCTIRIYTLVFLAVRPEANPDKSVTNKRQKNRASAF